MFAVNIVIWKSN